MIGILNSTNLDLTHWLPPLSLFLLQCPRPWYNRWHHHPSRCWSQNLGAVPVSSSSPSPRPITQQVMAALASEFTMISSLLTIPVTNMWVQINITLLDYCTSFLPAPCLYPGLSYNLLSALQKRKSGQSLFQLKHFKVLPFYKEENPKLFHWPPGSYVTCPQPASLSSSTSLPVA